MTLETISFIVGGFLVIVGILGGGLEIKEIKIPKVGLSVRLIAIVFGLAFIGLGIKMGMLTDDRDTPTETSPPHSENMLTDDRDTSTKTFHYPTIQGHRLDWCRQWAKDCGKGAANSFCRSKGYSRAKSWEIDSDIGQHSPTYVIETGQICDQSFCDGFKYIECE